MLEAYFEKLLKDIPRRGGLQNEWQHAVAVRQKAFNILIELGLELNPKQMGLLNLVALGHDVFEVAHLDADQKATSSLVADYSIELLEYLYLFTARHKETSVEHFSRILMDRALDRTIVLVVKAADCFVNSQYTAEEAKWHEAALKTPVVEAKAKYDTRYKLLLIQLQQQHKKR